MVKVTRVVPSLSSDDAGEYSAILVKNNFKVSFKGESRYILILFSPDG